MIFKHALHFSKVARPSSIGLSTAAVALLIVFEADAQVLVGQPRDVTDVRSISYVNTVPPKGAVGVTLWGSHYQLEPSQDQTLSLYTGFSPPAPTAAYQVSVAPNQQGATAIQAQGGEVGININSASIAANLSSRFDLGTVVLGVNLARPAQPFAVGKKAKYSFVLSIPRAEQANAGVAQVVAYYSLRDRVHNQSFWFGMVLFDTRGWYFQSGRGFEEVLWDQGTNQPIVHATAGHSSNLLDRDYPTSAFVGTPFSERRAFAFVIGAAQVGAALSMMKTRYPELAGRFSDDPKNYEIRHINLNPETHTPPGSFAQIGLSVIDWRLEIVP